MSPADRTKAIEKRIKEIVGRAEKENPGKRAEVSEMFIGKTYVLFIYTYLKDIRLVYVPPRSIGEFGGEDDNWMWPRHTGDFSFLRAYVAPDGSPADYSPQNVPFKPKRFLKIAPARASTRAISSSSSAIPAGPTGTTPRATWPTRRKSACPTSPTGTPGRSTSWRSWAPRTAASRSSYAARIKGLANTMKNYRGKLKGMKKVGPRRPEARGRAALQEFIDADPKREAALRRRPRRARQDLRRDAGRAGFRHGPRLPPLERQPAQLRLDRPRGLDRAAGSRTSSASRPTWTGTGPRRSSGFCSPCETFMSRQTRRSSRSSSSGPCGLKGPNRIAGLDELFRADDRGRRSTPSSPRPIRRRAWPNAEQAVADLLDMTPDGAQGRERSVPRPGRGALHPAVRGCARGRRRGEGALDPLFARLSEVEEAYFGTRTSFPTPTARCG